MNWEIVGALGEWAGAMVVAITLIFLARQIGAGRTQQRLESHRAMAELQMQTNRILYDTDNLHAVASTLMSWKATDGASRVTASMWLIDTATHYQVLFQMWSTGTVSDDFYRAEEDYFSTEILATAGGRVWWARNRSLFSRSFCERIDSQIPAEDGKYFQHILADLQRDSSVQ